MDTPLALFSDALEPIDATLSVGTIDGALGLIVEARGGMGRREYALAVSTTLARLARADVTSLEAFLIAGVRGGVAIPPLSERRVVVDGHARIDPTAHEPDALRLALGRAVAAVRPPEAKGSGNGTKRLFLVVPGFGPADWFDALDAPALIAAGLDTARVEAPGRERALATIVVRRGQPAFRKRLLAAYGGRCAVTGTTLEAVLEAAHIRPYDGTRTNGVENGLLLRADVHTLFDLYLLGVSPGYRVAVGRHPSEGGEYEAFEGRPIHLPVVPSERPAKDALAERMERMRRRDPSDGP